MLRIVLASPKGGVSKTTLAACLSVEASLHLQRVACVDLDPQQSLATWHGLRADAGIEGKPELVPTGAKLGSALDRVRAQPEPPDLLVIDCPPGAIGLTRKGIESASLVLVPMKASPLDVETADLMVDLCKEAAAPFVFLLAQVNAKRQTMTAGARDFLTERGEVLDVEMTDRQSYAEAMLSGRTGGETKDKTAKAEVAALWQALGQRLASTEGRAAA
jgi:chromosome partitioning protein